MSESELWRFPATELARLIRDRTLSPMEVVKVFLGRIEELNPRLNAFLSVVSDQTMADARRAEARVLVEEKPPPLLGVPVAVKDLI